MLTDWLVIAAQQNFDDDGTPTTSVAVLLPDEAFPHYRVLGLLRHATVRYEADLVEWKPADE